MSIPNPLPICNPAGNLLAATIIVGIQLGLWLQERSYLERAEVLPYVAPMLLLAMTILSGDFLEQILARVSLDRSRIFFIGGCFCLTVASIAGLRSHDVQDELAKGYAIPSTILKVLQIPFDKDGDGYATIFGGGDCNDFDSLIHPQAVEIYGNDVDENCDGDIAMKQASERKTIAPVFQLPIYQKPLNIVLITISNLRPDHLSFFGYRRQTTPNMDTFTSNSIYFTHAYSASPTMTYGLAAIHSGRYASELVRNDSNWLVLSRQSFLASRLKRRGYQTAPS